MAYVIGVFLTPVAALIGTLPFVLMMSAYPNAAIAALLVGLMIGSMFAAPVTILVLPTAAMLWPKRRDLSTPAFVAIGAVAGAVSTALLCRMSYQLTRDIVGFTLIGTVAGGLIAIVFVACARRWVPSVRRRRTARPASGDLGIRS